MKKLKKLCRCCKKLWVTCPCPDVYCAETGKCVNHCRCKACSRLREACESVLKIEDWILKPETDVILAGRELHEMLDVMEQAGQNLDYYHLRKASRIVGRIDDTGGKEGAAGGEIFGHAVGRTWTAHYD